MTVSAYEVWDGPVRLAISEVVAGAVFLERQLDAISANRTFGHRVEGLRGQAMTVAVSDTLLHQAMLFETNFEWR